ncbi:hypothetical protein V3C99_011559 [Haemonchus contortus]
MTCPRHTRALGDCAALIVCPYSRAHHISPAAFPGHLQSCRMEYLNNSQDIKVVRCRVDPRHVVPEVELWFHEKHCDDAYFRRINDELCKVMGTSATLKPQNSSKKCLAPSETSSDSGSSDSDSDISSSDSLTSSSTSLSDISLAMYYRLNNTLDV